MKKTTLFVITFFLSLEFVLGAHFIVGYVNDSYGGVLADGKTVVVWNQANGIGDNLTDIIGPTGNSGSSNFFLVDCELLQTPCQINDQISAMVVNLGDSNTSETKKVTVTGAGFDLMPDNRLNTPPNVSLTSPIDYYNSSGYTEFNCSFEDPDSNMDQVQLWGEWNGGWHLNETKSASGGGSSILFNKILTEGTYEWSCFAQDNLTTGNFAAVNKTLNVDTTPPSITSVEVNETTSCSIETVRINCTLTDAFLGIDTVIIQGISPSQIRTNFTASFLTGDTYYIDYEFTEVGSWKFNCIGNDSAGNENNLTSSNHENLPTADLKLTSENIFFNITPTIEDQWVNISANIENIGCTDSASFNVGFYEGNKSEGGISLQNQTVSITQLSFLNISINWQANPGTTNIFVYSDIDNDISENNESNNNANKTITLTGWQEIFGNATLDKKISSSSLGNLTDWFNETGFQGNIYITDSESTIDWYNLQAIGRNSTGSTTSNDFSDIDTLLSMTSFDDSVYNSFTNSGTPKETRIFNLFQYQIDNVSTINSTDNINFKTGILWDTSDDVGDGEYDTTDKEDLVFITEVNKSSIGKYEISDYEIRIPVKLREYYTADTQEVYYYYELN